MPFNLQTPNFSDCLKHADMHHWSRWRLSFGQTELSRFLDFTHEDRDHGDDDDPDPWSEEDEAAAEQAMIGRTIARSST